jgi:hypothetical protein
VRGTPLRRRVRVRSGMNARVESGEKQKFNVFSIVQCHLRSACFFPRCCECYIRAFRKTLFHLVKFEVLAMVTTKSSPFSM